MWIKRSFTHSHIGVRISSGNIYVSTSNVYTYLCSPHINTYPPSSNGYVDASTANLNPVATHSDTSSTNTYT